MFRIVFTFLPVTDNMRPNLGCYRNLSYPEPVYTPIHSPNLDSLAKESAIFEQAYIQWPYCGPSRAAILIGRWVINILLWCSLVFTSYGENYQLYKS